MNSRRHNETITFSKEVNSVKAESAITGMTAQSDGANIVLARKNKINLLFFLKLLNKEKPRKIINKSLEKYFENNIHAIEFHPFFDAKDNLAAAIGDILYVFKVSKGQLDSNRKFINQQHDKSSVVLTWQNCPNGLLASASGKSIKFYDLRTGDNPVHHLDESRVDIPKSIKFSNHSPNLFSVGYNKKLMLFDLREVQKKSNKKIINKELFDGDVDYVEWSPATMPMNNLIVGSLKDQAYKVLNISNKFEVLNEFNLKKSYAYENKPQGLLSFSFLPGSSIGIVGTNKMLIHKYHDNFKDIKSEQSFDFPNPITHFKLVEHNRQNYMATIDTNDFFNAQLMQVTEGKAGYSFYAKTRELDKKSSIIKDLDAVNKKLTNKFTIENTQEKEKIFTIRMTYELLTIRLKLQFKDDYPKSYPNIQLDDYYKESQLDVEKALSTEIESIIRNWREYENLSGECDSKILLELFTKICQTIEKLYSSINDNEEPSNKVKRDNNFVPYIKFNGLSWGPKGQLLTFRNNKIDFKILNLKPQDKFIKNVQDLQDWIKFGEADDNSKFSRHDNKLMEEESDQIVTESFRNLFDWKNMFEMDDNYVLSAINKSESLPYIFQNRIPDFKEHLTTVNTDTQKVSSKDFPRSFSSKIAKPNMFKSKKTISVTKRFEKEELLFESIKYRVLTKENFKAYLDSQIKANKEIQTLYGDILQIINYNINTIIEHFNFQLSENDETEKCLKLCSQLILSILKSLEKNKNLDVLVVCILFITTTIYEDTIKKFISIPESLKSNLCKEEENLGLDDNSDNGSVFRLSLDEDKKKTTDFTFAKITRNVDLEKKVRRTSKDNVFEKSNNPLFDAIKSPEKIQASPSTFNLQCFSDGKNNVRNFEDSEGGSLENHRLNLHSRSDLKLVKTEDKWLRVFGDKTITKFFDYLYVFSNKLFINARYIERAELVNFIYLISSKLGLESRHKYSNILNQKYSPNIPKVHNNNSFHYSYFHIGPGGKKRHTSDNNPAQRSDPASNELKPTLTAEVKKSVFKTEKGEKDYSTCDYCGQYLKIGTITVKTIDGKFQGHLHEGTNFIK